MATMTRPGQRGGFTTRWYASAWQEFQLTDVLIVTFEVVGAVVLLSGLLGVPAAYALARRNFPGKQIVMLLFLMPMMIPPITFGIPLATVRAQPIQRRARCAVSSRFDGVRWARQR